MDEKNLWKYIKKNTKPSYQADYDENDKLINNITNNGLNEGEVAVRGGGEYTGFSIKALELIKPLLTDARVGRAVRFMAEGDLQSAIATLQIVHEVREHGLGILYGVLKLWLEANEIPVPNEYAKQAVPIKSRPLLDWLNSGSYSSLLGKFEIVGIGFAHGHTIVPESWQGRIFNNADELHKKMDKLEWRQAKPNVEFCAIYAMRIKKMKTWDEIDPANLKDINVIVGISIMPKLKNDKIILHSDIQFFNKKKQYTSWLASLPSHLKVMTSQINTEEHTDRLLIACDIDKLIEKKPVYIKTKNVGLLVSTLQKLMRRGRGCAKAMKDILTDLWKSPAYNLPDQQFLRVNAGRQLTWRLLITTIEDVEPFITDKNSEYLSMMDIACLAVLANIYPDVQFIKPVFDKILHTALLVENNDQPGSKWKILRTREVINGDIRYIDTSDPLLKAFKMLAFYMPSRQFDQELLRRSFNYINKGFYTPKILPDITTDKLLEYGNKKEGDAGKLAGFDMHAYPNMLLLLQASLPFIPYNDRHTTQGLSKFIWDYSSSISVRVDPVEFPDDEAKVIFAMTTNIQNELLNHNFYKKEINKFTDKMTKYQKENKYVGKHANASELIARTGFLLLFGQKLPITHKSKRLDIVVAGTVEEPCKVKTGNKTESSYLEGEARFNGEIAYVDHLNTHKVIIDCPHPPIGFSWIWGEKKKIQINAKIVKSNKTKLLNDMLFYADDNELVPFDASNILIPLPKTSIITLIPNDIEKIISQMLYVSNKTGLDDYALNLATKDIKGLPLYNWFKIAKESAISPSVWKSVYVKLQNNYNNEVHIGPVDGSGGKVQNSIDYMFEGTLWRIFNLLSMIYPNTIINSNAVKSLKFKVNNNTSEYLDLIDQLNQLTRVQSNNKGEAFGLSKVRITTQLWPHQKNASEKMLKGMLLGKLGTASSAAVASGKTITSLAVMIQLYNHNIKNNSLNSTGFLVLVPTTYLYKTWQDEIIKHTKGFEIIMQNANGSLSNYPESDRPIIIKHNTILIASLSRMREHPLQQQWVLVTIDECLSVQNKSAKQTGEALKQIMSAEYGCILLSATFFRSRFDKLFYMLKMLNTGLPENKSYLDTILSESVVSNIPLKTRTWVTTQHAFYLSDEVQNDYNQILKQNLSSEKLFSKLQSYLHNNFDYISAFAELIKKSEKKGNRCLIYAKSKDEADLLAENIKNVSRFPDVSGTHLSISTTEGTYGLNNLIYLNTIITRPPNPDVLPQMKGRLDRPEQKDDQLSIKFLFVDNTVDNASIFRLELANNFRNHYILPISEYYELAVGKKKKEDIQYGGFIDYYQKYIKYKTKIELLTKMHSEIYYI